MKLTPRKVRKAGKIRWLVDLRYAQEKGGRHYFAEKEDAEKLVSKFRSEEDAVVLTGADKREYLTAKDIIKDGSLVAASLEYVGKRLPDSIPLVEAIVKCVSAKKRSGKNRDYLRTFELRLEKMANRFGNKLVSEVTASDVEDWLYARDEITPTTRRGMMIDAQTFFNFCIPKWTLSNPVSEVEEIEVGEFKRGILAPVQAGTHMEVCVKLDPGMARYFADQLFGGLRESEARFLERGQIKPGYVDLPDTKTKFARFVEFNDTWKAWLEKHPGKYFGELKNVNNRAAAIRIAVQSEIRKTEPQWETPTNCLRHSFCTYASKMWGPGRAAELAGHSEAMQKKHYRRPVTLEEAKSFWAILP